MPVMRTSSWVSKTWFFVAAISAADAFTMLTGWGNFAHHNKEHGLYALLMTAGWAGLGWRWYWLRRGR